MNYSQNLEQEKILAYFNGRTGTFLDIGSNDGVTLSNTRALAELQWRGVLVEPSPIAFKKLKENYKGMEGFYFYPFALGTTNGEVEFWDSGAHLNSGDHGLLSTLMEGEKQRWKDVSYEKIKVKCFRWKTFLNRLSVKNFDFISLDCEGYDLYILKQMDLRSTSCLCVEWNGKQDFKEEFDKLMIGFNVIYTSPENLIYAR